MARKGPRPSEAAPVRCFPARAGVAGFSSDEPAPWRFARPASTRSESPPCESAGFRRCILRVTQPHPAIHRLQPGFLAALPRAKTHRAPSSTYSTPRWWNMSTQPRSYSDIEAYSCVSRPPVRAKALRASTLDSCQRPPLNRLSPNPHPVPRRAARIILAASRARKLIRYRPPQPGRRFRHLRPTQPRTEVQQTVGLLASRRPPARKLQPTQNLWHYIGTSKTAKTTKTYKATPSGLTLTTSYGPRCQ